MILASYSVFFGLLCKLVKGGRDVGEREGEMEGRKEGGRVGEKGKRGED